MTSYEVSSSSLPSDPHPLHEDLSKDGTDYHQRRQLPLHPKLKPPVQVEGVEPPSRDDRLVFQRPASMKDSKTVWGRRRDLVQLVHRKKHLVQVQMCAGQGH